MRSLISIVKENFSSNELRSIADEMDEICPNDMTDEEFKRQEIKNIIIKQFYKTPIS